MCVGVGEIPGRAYSAPQTPYSWSKGYGKEGKGRKRKGREMAVEKG